MDVIHCYITELDDLFLLLKSPSINTTTREAISAQCRNTLATLITTCMELELDLCEIRSVQAPKIEPLKAGSHTRSTQKKIEIEQKPR